MLGSSGTQITTVSVAKSEYDRMKQEIKDLQDLFWETEYYKTILKTLGEKINDLEMENEILRNGE